MQHSPFKRWASYATLLVAAAASLATSAPSWEAHDSVEGLDTTLDANEPEAVKHFTVSSSHGHTVRVPARFIWDLNPSATVRVRIQKDTPEAVPQETIVKASEADDEGPGRKLDTYLSLGVSQECEKNPCEQGYTVSFRILDGAPQEKVGVRWSFEASIGGEGDDTPDDAFVRITED